MNFQKPNDVVMKVAQDPNLLFLGGRNWERITEDLSNIEAEHRPKFILSLFLIVLCDQCVHYHFRESYQEWRELTQFPKFGWSGFGPHNQHPLIVLQATERDNVIEPSDVIRLIPEFVGFLSTEISEFFTTQLPDIAPDTLLEKLHMEIAKAHDYDDSEIVKSFKLNFLTDKENYIT